MMHRAHNTPAPAARPARATRTDVLGPEIAAARAAGATWKDLEARYGLSRAWLDRIWGEFKGRRRCACPQCGHVFDPKRPASNQPGKPEQDEGGEDMARRGRKRKSGQRHKCGKLRRGAAEAVDRGTPEMQQQRAVTTGDQALSPDYPLSILLGRGLINPLQHDAGMHFARLYWTLFGKPFGRAQDYQQPRDIRESGGGGLSAGAELRCRAEYEAALAALGDLGAVGLITDLAVFLRRGWLVDAILRGANRHRRHQVRLQRIRQALDALANLPRVRVDREAIDRAEREVA
jgi:hypothetical protein